MWKVQIEINSFLNIRYFFYRADLQASRSRITALRSSSITNFVQATKKKNIENKDKFSFKPLSKELHEIHNCSTMLHVDLLYKFHPNLSESMKIKVND